MEQQVHNEIMRSLGRIEGKIEGILEQAVKTNGRVTKLEENVTTLKVTDGITTTKITIIAAAAGTVGAFILNLFI